MRTLFLLLLFVCSFNLFGQYDTKWEEVNTLELQGKIKSAQKEVEKIYKKAKRRKDEVQIVKCFFYLSKFEQVFDEKAQTTIISNLKEEIKVAQPVSKALLNYIYATILENYYQKNSYYITKNTNLKNQTSKDFLTWTTADFKKEIEKSYNRCLENETILRNTMLLQYKDVFEISKDDPSDTEKYTIYSFLSKKCVAYYKTQYFNNRDTKTPFKEINLLYQEPKGFVTHDFKEIQNEDLKHLIQIQQNNEKEYLNSNQEKIDEKHYYRLKFIREIFPNDSLFLKKANELEKKTTNQFIKQYLRADRLQHYLNKSAKKADKNYNKASLNLIDSILVTNVNKNALASAENAKVRILQKSLSLKMAKIAYPNQNNRAYVSFKNIDSITISYYLLPEKLNHLFENNYYRYDENLPNKDSILNSLVSKNNPLKKQHVKLPSINDHFTYSTEFLLDKLEVGNYLIYVEAPNYAELDKVAHAYERLQVTDLFVIEEKENSKDAFYVYQRKTGKPLKNIKFKNEEEISFSDSNGKAYFNLREQIINKDYSNKLEITNNKDTISKLYNRNFTYKSLFSKDDEFEDFDAKVMVYFDRAIYRPGQKMYYKGILLKNKDNKKSVVPFVSVHVTIQDVNSTTLKEFDIQTNEFGSFSGEFDIPKNTLTGEFSLNIDEAENYKIDSNYYDEKENEHKFWDNVNFSANKDFNFKVEEYKRPTFEVKFNEIKENYTIGDTLKIKGNAKALAGNNLTNAKVAYTISKRTNSKNDYIPYEKNYINKEITTDTNGDFTIEFIATDSIISNTEINSFDYTITADVTDTNGETRSESQFVTVGQNMLKLSLQVQNLLVIEEDNKVIINATTLNNHPIDTKGTLKIYEIQRKHFLKKRIFYAPEIQGFSREEFERLFPHEPYDELDYDTKENLVKTIYFDTKTNKEIALDFLKNYRNSEFILRIEANDAKNNLIKEERKIYTKSIKNPFSDEKLFTIKDISDTNSNFYTLEINSVIPDLFITSRYNVVDKMDSEIQTIQLKKGKAIFKFEKVKDLRGTITMHFSAVWENQGYQEWYKIDRKTEENKLKIAVESIRNKIEPGSTENWTFKIIDQKLEAEVLASMYDQSLDQFATNNWQNITFNNTNYYLKTPIINGKYEISDFDLKGFIVAYKSYYNHTMSAELNWFGFDFNNSKNKYLTEKYYKSLKPVTRSPKNPNFISGIVVDDLGPVAGATINIERSNIGTVSNFDGEFEIRASKGDVLIVSFAGSVEKFTIDDRRDYTLKLEIVELEDTVVTAYGIVRETKKLAYATEKVDAQELMQTTSKNTVTALAGRVSELNISTNGNVNPSTSIILRGYLAGTDNMNALIIIDGIITTSNTLENLSPDLIKDIQIMRGEEATALYGSQGKNGVIIITTKKAFNELSQVKTRTNFNETAFFYPNLKTDSSGKISFNFKTPESLTKWKLRLFAHNKKAEIGYFEASIISQKDVMIQTNMPRFVREKDTINISAKVVNMTNETKSGIAMLLLYDASTMEVIDSIAMNSKNTRNFSCKPKESVPVNWTITIPEGLQGLHYKIVAKSGNFSDGEENILPVLSNKILITESIPIWVKGNSKKEYSFDTLKNNTSKTLKNHLFTLEYTSNPVWLALQSLPYLMEYEHECAEQTFARYYANSIATELINSNPKIAALFANWKENPKAISKLTQNEELKSIVLNETPWMLAAENKEVKNKRLALLMDLNTMKESQAETFKKLAEKQNDSGGFPWFNGGEENIFITQHIVAGFGHLEKMFPLMDNKFEEITKKAIPYLDANFIKINSSKNKQSTYKAYLNLHYMYARSFYLDKMPISKKMDSLITIQKAEYKSKWLTYSLYEKTLLALIMHRSNDKKFAKTVINSLKETAARNEDNGMYWLENSNGYYWYQSAIETQALVIEAFSEIESDKKYVEEMKVWLLKNKQVNNWSSTKATSEAVYALLLQGTDWTTVKDNTKFKIGNEKVLTKKLSEKEKEAETGYIKMTWSAKEISKDMATISVDNKSEVPGYGAAYWQYFENLENIKTDSTATLSITKNLYKKIKNTTGNELVDITSANLIPGDLVTIRLIIKTENDLEFVHLKDLRASCFEPVDVISKYKWQSNLSYYQSTKDVATHFFFDTIRKGTYIIEYDVRINNSGSFNDGIATLQSMYAPEFTGHSTSTKVKTN